MDCRHEGKKMEFNSECKITSKKCVLLSPNEVECANRDGAIINYLKAIGAYDEKVAKQRVLDATCGSRMIWFNKKNEDVLYMDNRQLSDTLCDGRALNINPDVVADFRNMPFEDNAFYLVVFDPPHLLQVGTNSWLAKKYGKLGVGWKEDIKQGFNECMRVLKPNGTLIFKWNEAQIKLSEILEVIDIKPLFGNRRSKTHWLVFIK